MQVEAGNFPYKSCRFFFKFFYFSCYFQKICPWCAGTERCGGSPGPLLTAAQGAGARRRRGRARLLLREHLSALLSGSGGALGCRGAGAAPAPSHFVPALGSAGGCSRTQSGRGAGLHETRGGS